MAVGFRDRKALPSDGLFQPVGAAGSRRLAKSFSRTRRGLCALSSLVFHLSAIGLLSWAITHALPPDRPDAATVEMVFVPAPAALPLPEPVAQPVSEAEPPPPDISPMNAPVPELVAPREPVALPPPPKPRPKRVSRTAAPRSVEQPVTTAPAPAAPVVAAPVVATPVPARLPAVDAHWQSEVARWLASHRNYPAAARRRGEEGRVAIRFTVDRSGQVRDAEIVSSSGSERLDGATLAMLRDATLPGFPATMSQDRVTVTTTVRYSLR